MEQYVSAVSEVYPVPVSYPVDTGAIGIQQYLCIIDSHHQTPAFQHWLVCTTRAHKQRVERVMGVDFQPGLDSGKIVSASQAGDIQFLEYQK